MIHLHDSFPYFGACLSEILYWFLQILWINRWLCVILIKMGFNDSLIIQCLTSLPNIDERILIMRLRCIFIMHFHTGRGCTFTWTLSFQFIVAQLVSWNKNHLESQHDFWFRKCKKFFEVKICLKWCHEQCAIHY